jgi:hypothetical protein
MMSGAGEPRGRVAGTRKRAGVTALGAALLFGGWAAFANWDHGAAAVLRATLAQAGLSATSTFAAVLLLEFLFNLAEHPALRFALGALATPLCMFAAMAVVHLLAGTPRILVTIAPSLVSGSIFCVTYTAGLLATARRRERALADPRTSDAT